MIWARGKTESAKAYVAFEKFLSLGANRSVPETYRQHTGNMKAKQAAGYFNKWAKDYQWIERAQAYDLHQDKIKQEAADKATRAEQEQWTKDTLKRARKIFDKADKMLDMPLITTQSKDGQTIVNPARWQMRDAAVMSSEAVKMARLAMGQPTDHSKVESMTPEQVAEETRKRLREVLADHPNLTELERIELVRHAADKTGIPEAELVV